MIIKIKRPKQMNTSFSKAYRYQEIFNSKNPLVKSNRKNYKRTKAMASNILLPNYTLIYLKSSAGTSMLSLLTLLRIIYAPLTIQIYFKHDPSLMKKEMEIYMFLLILIPTDIISLIFNFYINLYRVGTFFIA